MNKAELLHKAKPILFNTEMVKAILDGRKTQTRRIAVGATSQLVYDNGGGTPASRYQKGDILYVRETWTIGTFEEDDSQYKEYWYIGQYSDSKDVFYKADLDDRYSDDDNECKWKPSIHMPKKYARIFLKVMSVRVERLRDIGEDEIVAEGIDERSAKLFTDWVNLWNSTAKDGYKWENNPYVFVYEFERVR